MQYERKLINPILKCICPAVRFCLHLGPQQSAYWKDFGNGSQVRVGCRCRQVNFALLERNFRIKAGSIWYVSAAPMPRTKSSPKANVTFQLMHNSRMSWLGSCLPCHPTAQFLGVCALMGVDFT